jgi:tRNA pseudouridine55 synthase
MNGLLLVNKPVGITSFDVIRRLRTVSGVKKIGHAGTLDPLASGLMLLLFGTACREAQQFSKLDKRYVAQATLGADSATGDNEGEKTAVSNYVPTRDELDKVVRDLTGDISQVPSPYSAIKIRGQEAYKRVRAGEVVEMPPRQVTVYEFGIIAYDYPNLEFDVRVSSGTYIRTLAQDLGELAGTGAYLSGLVRTEVGRYRLEEAINLDQANTETIAERLKNV